MDKDGDHSLYQPKASLSTSVGRMSFVGSFPGLVSNVQWFESLPPIRVQFSFTMRFLGLYDGYGRTNRLFEHQYGNGYCKLVLRYELEPTRERRTYVRRYMYISELPTLVLALANSTGDKPKHNPCLLFGLVRLLKHREAGETYRVPVSNNILLSVLLFLRVPLHSTVES